VIFLLLLITQIITESLPISSSGHVKLLETIGLKLDPQANYNLIPKSLEYFFHGPTILILLIFFFKEILNLLFNFNKNFEFIFYWTSLIFIADLITVIFYFVFEYFQVKNILLNNNFSGDLNYFWGFLITSLLLISLKFISNNNLTKLNYKHAIILGIVQGISLLPGISRLASTIVIACWLGATYQTAFYFSCAIQFPLICAGFFKGCYFVYQNQALFVNFLRPTWLFSLAAVISSLVSLIALYLTYLIFLSGCGYYWSFYMIIPTILAFIFGI
jgi:undecaprenyl-diphosphatase